MSLLNQLTAGISLVNQAEEHNKFWSIKLDETNLTVTRSWGRLGAKGGSKTDTFSTLNQAYNYAVNKYNEQRYTGGYREITTRKLQQLNIEAQIVGLNNKCLRCDWVDIETKEGAPAKATIASDARLQDPDCDPGLYVVIQPTQGDRLNLLFYGDNVYSGEFNQQGTMRGKLTRLDLKHKTDKSVKLALKVQSLLVLKFSA